MRLNAERSQWEVELELPAGKHAFKCILVPPGPPFCLFPLPSLARCSDVFDDALMLHTTRGPGHPPPVILTCPRVLLPILAQDGRWQASSKYAVEDDGVRTGGMAPIPFFRYITSRRQAT